MGDPTKLTKKQKKAVAFRERKGKGKGKAQDAQDDPEANAVPTMEDQDLAEMEGVEDEAAVEKHVGGERDGVVGKKGKGKSQGKAKGDEQKEGERAGKKRKRGEQDGMDVDGVVVETRAGAKEGAGAEEKRARKKRRGNTGESTADGVVDGESAPRKQKFILFIGNLKYTTTKEAIAEHFSACGATPNIRLPTPKGSTRPKTKGYAFVEFDDKKVLQEALKMHLSVLEGRKINVELTAGGGGKSETRLNKLKTRNKELNEQRTKRVEKRNATAKEGEEPARLEQPQRHSTTSGIEQAPVNKRTWSVPEAGDNETHRGGKKNQKRGVRKPKDWGTGVNSIPVG